MRKQKSAKILKGLIVGALMLLALELGWLVFNLHKSEGAAESAPTTEETAGQQQEEILTTETPETEEYNMPWEAPSAKQPVFYTWEAYQMLTEEQQKAFREYLGTEAFKAWMEYVQEQTTKNPWDDPNAKQPADYTWEEFEALTPEQEILFQNSFESLADFDIWLQSAQSQQNAPTVDLGDKSIWDFTWTEFENMSVEEQMAFQYTFESPEDFDRWLQEAQGNTGSFGELPWERDGRRPEDYTWAEFEALSPEHQIIFQSSFATEDGFEQWLMANLPQ